MLNDFDLNNAHPESAKIEQWSILSTKQIILSTKEIHYLETESKFNPTVGRCQKGYRQIKEESRKLRD